MDRVAEETAEALTQTDGQTENRPSRDALDAFVALVEEAIAAGETDTPAMIDAQSLPSEQTVAMVDGLEALSFSEEPAVQVWAVDLNHQALESAVRSGQMPFEHLDRLRNNLVDLMNSSNDVVRAYAITAFWERADALMTMDTTTYGWLINHLSEPAPREIHGDSYLISERQKARLIIELASQAA